MDVGATVTIDGTDYSSTALEGVTIEVGRTGVDETVRPHAATIALLHRTIPTVNPNTFEIGQTVEVTIDRQNTAGTHLLFVGQITDVVINYNTLQIVAVSAPIVDLARQDITTTGETGTVLEAFTGLYAEISSPSYEPAGGFYALGAGQTVNVPAGTYNALEALSITAGSAIEGLVNQDAGENVFFTTAEDRRTYTADLILDDTEVLIDFEVTRRREQLVNRVEIDWTGGTETAEDATSITNFGILTKSIQTYLDTGSDATDYADFEIGRSTIPAFWLDRIVVPAHLLSAADYDTLVAAPIRQPTTPIAWQDVPAGIAWDDLAVSQIWQDFQIDPSTAGAFLLRIPNLFAGLPQDYFIEGATYTIGRNTIEVDLSISEASLTRPLQRWVDVPGVLVWQNVDATQTWADLNKEQVST